MDRIELTKDQMLELFSLLISNLIKKPHELHIHGTGVVEVHPTKFKKSELSSMIRSSAPSERMITSVRSTGRLTGGAGKILTDEEKLKIIAKYSTFSEGGSLGSSPPATNSTKAGTGKKKKFLLE